MIDQTQLSKLPQNGAFSLQDAVARGVSRRSLEKLREAGFVARVGWGAYVLSSKSGVDFDVAEAMLRAPEATLCLTSALAYWELIDEIPAATDLALPRGTTPPRSASSIHWHLFNAETFDVGRVETPNDAAIEVLAVYSAERSIVDAFRLRHSVGYEVAVEALRTWLARRGSQPRQLLEIADRIPRSRGPLRTALEVLL